MLKDFDRWNASKKKIDREERPVDFHEREIWWCSVGVNVGSEQHSQSVDFSRPIVIVKRFTARIFWGVPLTTKIRTGEYRIRFGLNGIDNDMLVWHMRSFDRKRLVNKIGVLPRSEFQKLIAMTVNILAAIIMKTPMQGVSEAEASGLTETGSSPYAISIGRQRILSNFFGDRYFSRAAIICRTP